MQKRIERSVWSELKVGRTLAVAFGTVLLFSFLINILILTSPVYMMQVFDRVLVTGQVETLVYLTAIAGLAIITLGVLEGVRGQLLNRVAGYLDRVLREPVLNHVIAQSRVEREGRNRLLDDLGVVRNYLGSPAVLPIVDAPWVPLFIIVISILHPMLGLLATAAAVVLFGLALANDRLSRDLLRVSAAQNSRSAQFAGNAIANSDAIHAMGMQAAVSGRYSAGVASMAQASERAADVNSTVSGISKAVRIAVQVGILALGAYLVTIAELTAGGMIAASIVLGRALAPIEQSISSWRQFRNTQDSYARIRAFLSARPAEPGRMRLPALTGKLSVEDVSYQLAAQERFVLQHVGFELAPGNVLAIIGPSASGKSTLCKLIVGSWSPSFGKVRIDGAEVISLHPEDQAAAIGYLPQDVELFSGTVKENIARMGAPDDQAVVEAATAAGCHDLVLRLPESYETEVGPNGMYLSGGQRQRIGLARALYGNPKVIVLDEPNASLDQDGEARLVEAVRQRKEAGATVIVVSHRVSLLNPADKIAVLKDGHLARFGDRDDVIAELQTGQRRQGPTLSQGGGGQLQ